MFIITRSPPFSTRPEYFSGRVIDVAQDNKHQIRVEFEWTDRRDFATQFSTYDLAERITVACRNFLDGYSYATMTEIT